MHFSIKGRMREKEEGRGRKTEKYGQNCWIHWSRAQEGGLRRRAQVVRGLLVCLTYESMIVQFTQQAKRAPELRCPMSAPWPTERKSDADSERSKMQGTRRILSLKYRQIGGASFYLIARAHLWRFCGVPQKILLGGSVVIMKQLFLHQCMQVFPIN